MWEDVYELHRENFARKMTYKHKTVQKCLCANAVQSEAQQHTMADWWHGVTVASQDLDKLTTCTEKLLFQFSQLLHLQLGDVCLMPPGFTGSPQNFPKPMGRLASKLSSTRPIGCLFTCMSICKSICGRFLSPGIYTLLDHWGT